MGKPTGFLEFERELPKKRRSKERVNDYNELVQVLDESNAQPEQRVVWIAAFRFVIMDVL